MDWQARQKPGNRVRLIEVIVRIAQQQILDEHCRGRAVRDLFHRLAQYRQRITLCDGDQRLP